MRYKNNVLDKLVQTEAIANRIQLQVNRSMPQDQVIESVEQLKESIDKIREIVSIEQDEFANQFAGR
jgi:DNA-binding transcriptional regulator YiaG